MNESDVIKLVLTELEKRGIIKNNDSTFKNVELLLYNYNALKESIKDRASSLDDFAWSKLSDAWSNWPNAFTLIIIGSRTKLIPTIKKNFTWTGFNTVI